MWGWIAFVLFLAGEMEVAVLAFFFWMLFD
jgi:hypothetical protein